MKNEIDYITGFRGILVIAVVFHHYSTNYPIFFTKPEFFWDLTNGGIFAVAFFFILSGYFLERGVNKFYVLGIKKWLIHKYLRLYPEFIVSILMLFLVLQFYPLPERTGNSWIDLLKEVPMLPYLSFHMEEAHWYLASLLCSFGSFAFLAQLRWHNKVATYWIALFLNIISFVLKECCISIWGVSFFISFVNKFVNISIFTGMLSYLSSKQIHFKILLFFYLTFLTIKLHIILFPIVFILLWLCLNNQYDKYLNIIKKILGNKFIVYIGGLSYMWYVMHQNVGYIVMQNLERYINYEMLPYITVCVTFTFCIFLQKVADVIRKNIYKRIKF